ncbi:MAG: hypothetical protein JWM42_2813 [Burkholderia sp.]|nr:hypothetical protein [Burkholderia sp.]
MKPNVIIIAKGVSLSRTLREYIVRRLRFALNGTPDNTEFITVRINDQNGPKGGVDKHCRIHLALPGRAAIVITEKASDIIAAVNVAAHRAAIAVTRSQSRAKVIAHSKFSIVIPDPALP